LTTESSDAALGRKAVELGFITAQQLSIVLDELTRRDPTLPPATLKETLLSQGILTEEQVRRLSRSPVNPGDRLGKYHIIRELGRGGMGIVFEATDVELNRPVALKMLREDPSGEPGTASREEEERFILEARLTANLPRHPHLVSVYEAGILEGHRFIAMEYIPGQDFSRWRHRDGVALRDQVAVLRDIASAVGHAHRHGVIHRDLKPGNVLLDAQGVPHVTDFGIARRIRRDARSALTMTGIAIGTPSYMSPEQAEGRKDIDPRADVWALGVLLYEILTNRLPFEGQTALEILLKAIKDPVPRPSTVVRGNSSPALRDLERICLRALEKDVRDRTPSADEFSEDLSRWLKGETLRAWVSRRERRKRWTMAATALAFLGAAGGGLLLLPPADTRAAERDLRSAREYALTHPEDVDGQLEAWQKAAARAQGTPYGPEVTRERDSALIRGRTALARDLAVLDRDLEEEKGTLHYGAMKQLLAQSRARHSFGEWAAEIGTRERDLDRLIARNFADMKDRMVAAKARGDLRALEACRGNVVRQWNLPALEQELEKAVTDTPLGKIHVELTPPSGVVEQAPIRGHANGLQCVAFSPDGKSLLTSSYDKTLRLWTLDDRTERMILFKGEECNKAAFSPDGRWIAAGFWDGSVRIWDSGSLESRTVLGHRQQVRSVLFSGDSKTLISGSTDRSIRLSNVSTREAEKIFENLPRGVMSLALSGDGHLLAAGCGSGAVRVWELPEASSFRSLDYYSGGAVALAADPEGRRVLAGYMDGRIVEWDPASGRASRWEGHQSEVRDLAFSPDGKLVASASTDGSLRLWDAESGKGLGGFLVPGGFYGVAFSRQGNLLAGASATREALLWDLRGLRK
jgi:hypothetical protein